MSKINCEVQSKSVEIVRGGEYPSYREINQNREGGTHHHGKANHTEQGIVKDDLGQPGRNGTHESQVIYPNINGSRSRRATGAA